jgi:hypothetical protein
MVALHHAEIACPFGAIREGILLSAILPEIQQFLLALATIPKRGTPECRGEFNA